MCPFRCISDFVLGRLLFILPRLDNLPDHALTQDSSRINQHVVPSSPDLPQRVSLECVRASPRGGATGNRRKVGPTKTAKLKRLTVDTQNGKSTELLNFEKQKYAAFPLLQRIPEVYPTGLPSQHSTRKMPRGKAWSESEDKSLCWAWCAASEDPVSGADQKPDTLWFNIQRNFKELETKSTRSLSVMKSRLVDTNREVARFSGCVSFVANLNESGIADCMLV
ncbi:unnamed protein product [Phytophthora fragariaefolia]|uniref:Unnamed protein product n=1 Tax=Phytophthora fragariaefolia TaxID=1490495 RepID=A0A9W6XV24_9STRA|nr:unnamed protein product [Phytophthora fragariaefolia]